MQKYEDTDPTGLVALDEDFLPEKVKIYIQEGDSDNALVYAERLLRIKPQQFSYYGLVFNLRMAAAKYKEAAAVLEDAGKLPLSYEQRTALTTEKISMYIELSNVYPESEAQYYSEALRLIGEIEKDKDLYSYYYEKGQYEIKDHELNELNKQSEIILDYIKEDFDSKYIFQYLGKSGTYIFFLILLILIIILTIYYTIASCIRCCTEKCCDFFSCSCCKNKCFKSITRV